MFRFRHLTLALTVGYPIALHWSIVQGNIRTAVWILLLLSLAHSLLALGAGGVQRIAELVAPALATATAISLYLNDASILYLPPILINATLLLLFGRTLLPGQEPLITQFARRVEGEKDEDVLKYTSGLTRIWTLFFILMLIEAIGLALFAPIEIWSLFTNLINYLLMLGLFLIEIVYRVIRFRRLPSPGSLKKIFRPMD